MQPLEYCISEIFYEPQRRFGWLLNLKVLESVIVLLSFENSRKCSYSISKGGPRYMRSFICQSVYIQLQIDHKTGTYPNLQALFLCAILYYTNLSIACNCTI
jgi:hypothetical protein